MARQHRNLPAETETGAKTFSDRKGWKMKLGKLFALGLAVVICQFLLSNHCSAENWQIEFGWKNKQLYYVDTDSIKVNPKEYQVKFTMKHVDYYGSWDLQQIVYNYRTERYAILQMKRYDKNNKLIKTIPGDPKESEPVERENPMKAAVDEVLAFKGLQGEAHKNPPNKK